jgi:hypothetical protein
MARKVLLTLVLRACSSVLCGEQFFWHKRAKTELRPSDYSMDKYEHGKSIRGYLGRKFFSRQTTRLVDMKKLLKRQKLSIAKIAALTKDF